MQWSQPKWNALSVYLKLAGQPSVGIGVSLQPTSSETQWGSRQGPVAWHWVSSINEQTTSLPKSWGFIHDTYMMKSHSCYLPRPCRTCTHFQRPQHPWTPRRSAYSGLQTYQREPQRKHPLPSCRTCYCLLHIVCNQNPSCM